jgi:hypothetical protein
MAQYSNLELEAEIDRRQQEIQQYLSLCSPWQSYLDIWPKILISFEKLKAELRTLQVTLAMKDLAPGETPVAK